MEQKLADGKYKIIYIVGYANSFDEACKKCEDFEKHPNVDGDEFEIIADGKQD